MKSFGKYAILDNVRHSFTLEPDWWWEIKPPTGKDELVVTRLLATEKTKREADGTVVSLQLTTLDVAMREIAVTFGGTNIPTSESDPRPILKQGASWQEVEEVLKEMPRAMILELWNAVGDAVPGWGPVKPPAPREEQPADAGETEKN